jgi:AraC-like DNA-binding protein
MAHLTIVLTVLSFSIGVAALALYFLLFFVYRSQIVKCFLALQALITTCVFLNFIYQFIASELARSPPLLLAWYGVDYLWSGFFFYYYGLFFFNLTGTHFAESRKRPFRFVSAAIALTGVLPFLMNRRLEGLVAQFDWQSCFILVPSGLVVILIATVVEIASYRRIADDSVRLILRIDLAFKAVLLPAYVVAFILNADRPELQNDWMYALRNIYFLTWNVASVLLAAAYVRKENPALFHAAVPGQVIGDIKAAGEVLSVSVRKYEKSGLVKEEAELDIGRIDRFMKRDKPFLDAAISLPRLAELLGMPRNRLSQLLNEFMEQNFYDFLNEYRVEEAKRLLSGASEADGILDIAFDAGFNSKATFNSAFKRSTGMTPTEYRSSTAKARKQRLTG